MKEEFIIRFLDKAQGFIEFEKIKKLKQILEEELYNYDFQPKVTALVPINNIIEKIFIFLAAKKLDGRSKNTLEAYKRYLLHFSRFIQKDVEHITTMDARMFLATYVKAEVKNNTIATIISILKSFFEWLETNDYIAKSPMRKIPTTKVEKHLRKALTPEELEMLRVACKTERENALVEFFYSTGCRLDEVQKLNKDDILWSEGSLRVIGKGNKERQVFLNAKAKIHLWRYLNIRTDVNEALIVSSKNPYGRLGRRSIEIIFNDLGKRAGITKQVYPHLLRHTTATNMLNSGASLMEVQKYLGHDSPVTTQIYAQLDTEAIRYSHKKHLA